MLLYAPEAKSSEREVVAMATGWPAKHDQSHCMPTALTFGALSVLVRENIGLWWEFLPVEVFIYCDGQTSQLMV